MFQIDKNEILNKKEIMKRYNFSLNICWIKPCMITYFRKLKLKKILFRWILVQRFNFNFTINKYYTSKKKNSLVNLFEIISEHCELLG